MEPQTHKWEKDKGWKRKLLALDNYFHQRMIPGFFFLNKNYYSFYGCEIPSYTYNQQYDCLMSSNQ